MAQIISSLIPIVALIGVMYVLFRPHWVFAIIIAMFPLEQLLQAHVPFLTQHHQYVNIAIGVLALLAIVIRGSRREPIGAAALNPMAICVFAFYAFWAMGVVYSPNESALANLIFAAPYIVLLVALLPLLVVDLEDLNRILVAYLLLGSVIAVLIMIHPDASFYAGRLRIDQSMTGLQSRRSNPLALATMGCMMAMIAAFIKPRRVGRLMTLIRVGAFVIGLGLAVASGSRGQVLGAGLVGMLCFPLARRLDNPRRFFAGVVGFGFLLGLVYLTLSFFITQDNRERWDVMRMIEDIGTRGAMAADLFSVYLSKPSAWLMGLGPGAFEVYSRFDSPYVHNVVVEIMCEHGLVGTALFTAICIFMVRSLRDLWLTIGDDPVRRSTAALLITICMFALLQSLKQGTIGFPQPFCWWLVFAKIAAHEKTMALRRTEEAYWADDELPEEGYDEGEYEPALSG